MRTQTRHAGLVPASTVPRAPSLVARWTPAQGRGDGWIFVTVLACSLALGGCSFASTTALPPFADIEKATRDYVTCIDQTAPKFAGDSGSTDQIAPRIIASCRDLRSTALKLKSVPVMYPTIAEFDDNHLGFAKQAIEKLRKKS